MTSKTMIFIAGLALIVNICSAKSIKPIRLAALSDTSKKVVKDTTKKFKPTATIVKVGKSNNITAKPLPPNGKGKKSADTLRTH